MIIDDEISKDSAHQFPQDPPPLYSELPVPPKTTLRDAFSSGLAVRGKVGGFAIDDIGYNPNSGPYDLLHLASLHGLN
ncbi:hypothetical protein BDZ89DRAFT_1066291 [Hymenopellis radicata]|nr:hypothetical protein BDZ89DRAFT_1066291 [Hymenopellis radicata]